MLDMITALIRLDLAWWIGLIMNNLLWVFMFTALFYFYTDSFLGKKWFLFATEFFVIWTMFDVLGWVWFTTAFPVLFFGFHALARTFLENSRFAPYLGIICTAFLFLSSGLIN